MTSFTFEKILIIRLSSLGDVLLTTPLLSALKREYPSCRIDFLVREEYSDVLRHNPHVNKLFKFTRNSNEELNLKKELISNCYTLVIDLQNNFRSRSLTSGVNGNVVRFYKNTIRKFLLVNFKINMLKESAPIPERYAEAAGVRLNENDLVKLYLPEPDSNEKIQRDNKIIGLCPGAKHYTKRWLKEYYIELGKKLIKNSFSVCLLGGKDDNQLCEEISKEIHGVENLSTDNNLYGLAFNMKQCSAVVCNDSGLMHLGSALQIPVVAIFGSTVKEFGFFPYKNRSRVIENNSLTCRPCSHIGRERCPKKHFKCMRDIQPNDVYKTITNLISND